MNQLPAKLLERLEKLYSPKEFEQVLASFQTKLLPSFRTNTLKTTTDKLKNTLIKQGFLIEHVMWYKDAFVLKNKSVRELTETYEYQQGYIYIQNLSSMIPSLVLDPHSDEMVLDIAAAPGSKTTHLAMLMQNQGKIVANDISRPRLYKLHANLKMYGVENTIVANNPGQNLWKTYPEYFDKTLVDAPCSMEGRITLDDPDSYKDWKLGKIKDLEVKQKHLLRSAITATKVGGVIIYSTCTLAPEENEGVIDWIVKKEGDAIAIETIDLPHLALEHGITHWNKQFQPQTAKTARITPNKAMEGFFIAKIKKLRSIIPQRVF